MADERKVLEVQITGIGDAVSEIQRLIKLVGVIDGQMDGLADANKKNTKEYASLTAELKMYRTQLNAVTKETAQAIRVTNEKAGYLEKLEQDVRSLEQAYRRLSEAEFKGTQGKAMLENLKKQRAALASAQADYGKYSMNVGNYASATNMLAINVGQVMKEIPNFAISARIGIMSLTNNLPMLGEAIKAVRVQQQAMIAEGQKAPSMFSLISKSVFGLTGVLSIAMVFLQLYGARIVEWIGSLFKAKNAVDELTKSIQELEKESFNKLKNDYEKITKFQLDYQKAVKKADKDRLTALDEFAKKEFNIDDDRLQRIKNGLDTWKNFFRQYLKMAEDTYFNESLIKKKVEASLDLDLARRNLETSRRNLYTEFTDEQVTNIVQGRVAVWNSVGRAYKKAAEEFNAANESVKKLQPIGLRAISGNYIDTKATTTTSTTTTETIIKGVEDAVTDVRLTNALLDLEEKFRNAMKIAAPEIDTEQIISSITAIEDATKQQNETMIDMLSNLDTEYVRDLITYEQYIQRKKDILEDALNAGLDIGKENFEEWKKLYKEDEQNKETSEAKKKQIVNMFSREAQLLVRSLSDYYDAVNDAELQNYAQTITGKANYDELYAQKKYELEYEGAKRKKQLGIFNAIIDTAGAIIGFLKDPSGIAGTILSAMAGVTGAIQIATIAKQPLPVAPSGGGSMSGTKSTVKEKFHTGTYRPASSSEEQEITRTLLTTERVLSPAQTSVFDSIIGRMQSFGGSGAITSGVGVSQMLEEQMIQRAMTNALMAQKAPLISWAEFENQAMRQQKLRNNMIIG
jgi:hypothetical protein